jgi:hypothetical protein
MLRNFATQIQSKTVPGMPVKTVTRLKTWEIVIIGGT